MPDKIAVTVQMPAHLYYDYTGELRPVRYKEYYYNPRLWQVDQWICESRSTESYFILQPKRPHKISYIEDPLGEYILFVNEKGDDTFKKVPEKCDFVARYRKEVTRILCDNK